MRSVFVPEGDARAVTAAVFKGSRMPKGKAVMGRWKWKKKSMLQDLLGDQEDVYSAEVKFIIER